MSPRARQAVVLAAGRGSRLGAAGESGPKCLLPLAGRPLLHWTLDALHACGVDRILLVAGRHSEQLALPGCETVVNAQWAESGAVRSLQCASAWLERAPTLVLYGDGAYGAAVLRRTLDAADADLLVPGDRQWHSLWARRFADPVLDAESWRSHDDTLLDIGRRCGAIDTIQAQFMGLLRFTPSGWRQVRDRLQCWQSDEGRASVDRMDTTTMLRRLIDAGMRVDCIHVDGGWVEIDTLHDRDVVERALETAGFEHDFR